MEFETHKQIDDHYRKQGVDVDKLNYEFEQTKQILMNEQDRAKKFLKEKMGRIRYFFWKLGAGFPMGVYLSAGFGYDGWIEKAKELGFKDNIDFAVKDIMEDYEPEKENEYSDYGNSYTKKRYD